MTAHPTYLKLKDFLENREVCRRASAPMKPQARARIRFSDHEGDYIFRRDAEGGHLEPARGETPDFTLRLPAGLVDGLCAMETENIGEYGVFIFRRGRSDDPNYRIEGGLHEGFWTLWRHGYFGILRLGGWHLAKYLASQGVASLGVIRRKIAENQRPR